MTMKERLGASLEINSKENFPRRKEFGKREGLF
jgi:hypothetical protein